METDFPPVRELREVRYGEIGFSTDGALGFYCMLGVATPGKYYVLNRISKRVEVLDGGTVFFNFTTSDERQYFDLYKDIKYAIIPGLHESGEIVYDFVGVGKRMSIGNIRYCEVFLGNDNFVVCQYSLLPTSCAEDLKIREPNVVAVAAFHKLAIGDIACPELTSPRKEYSAEALVREIQQVVVTSNRDDPVLHRACELRELSYGEVGFVGPEICCMLAKGTSEKCYVVNISSKSVQQKCGSTPVTRLTEAEERLLSLSYEEMNYAIIPGLHEGKLCFEPVSVAARMAVNKVRYCEVLLCNKRFLTSQYCLLQTIVAEKLNIRAHPIAPFEAFAKLADITAMSDRKLYDCESCLLKRNKSRKYLGRGEEFLLDYIRSQVSEEEFRCLTDKFFEFLQQ